MIDCTVVKPFEHGGRIVKVGDSISLHPRQAESLRLQGKVKPAKAKKQKETKVSKTENK
jgi:hypothetical protein